MVDELRSHVSHAFDHFTDEQLHIFTTVQTTVASDHAPSGLLIFIDGKAGRGKTFLINAICSYVRSRGEIVLATATSAFAAHLYPGGTTVHAAFKVCFSSSLIVPVLHAHPFQTQVPVNEQCELLRSPIEPRSPRAELLKAVKVLIWDEAPMANKAVLACVDDVLRRATCLPSTPFGGKIVILAGDFRQTCPVIRGGTRAQIVDASIRSSPHWPLFTVFRLTRPIRNATDPEFAAWVDAIGEDRAENVDISFLATVRTEHDLMHAVFPTHILSRPELCAKRSILCPTNNQIDQYNSSLLERVVGANRVYLAGDTLKQIEDAGFPCPQHMLDFLTTKRIDGLPAHSLRMKTNGVYRLLRNFSVENGLVKNARVIVRAIGQHLITVCLIRDGNELGPDMLDENILIPRISFEHVIPLSGYCLVRRQFPLAPAYATTFNSCQGLTMAFVGVDLTRPVFSHGQLYTAISRVRTRRDIVVRPVENSSTVSNVTFPELLLP
jgi:hypothetical protein